MSRSVSVVTNEGSDLSLEYDGYGRVAEKVLTREGRTILTVEYTYRNTDANSTTGQIASITIGTNGASRSYTYSYDANGNITSVTEGNNATTYTYDKAGQLLRENNQAAGKTWVWEYDDAGNIESRTEYAYTTGNLGAALDTVEYQYNNDNWGDLLTSYDGNTITYDEIGNPLNDGTWEYTWEHGRQLSSMTDGTVTLNYEYNADGIRTKKTVITASDHSHIFQARVVAPACTENGYTLHECSCGYSWQSNPVVATGHSFTTTEVEATCTAHGYTLMECECGYGYQEGSQGHTFTATVVEPTAEENGYTLHSCECGYSYQDTPVAALGITNPTANGTAANTVVYDYVYNGSSLSYLTVTSTNFGADPVTEELYFGNGTVAYGDDVYYYVTNLQGDVVAIIDADGNVKVEYTYDAWGKILSISGPMADTLGAVNPLTYRGYVYDTETELYYLQSRYYDPAVERFINGDALISSGGLLSNNLFAYCYNAPVQCIDPDGYKTIWNDLFADHRFGYIHHCVELHILETYNLIGVFTNEKYVSTGRADIVDVNTNEVWEIKHGRSEAYYEERISQAEKQLERYERSVERLKRGAAGKFTGEFVINSGNYSYLIKYNTPKAGVILYTVTPIEYQKEAQYVYQSSRVSLPQAEVAPEMETFVALGGAALIILCTLTNNYPKPQQSQR